MNHTTFEVVGTLAAAIIVIWLMLIRNLSR